MSVVDAESRLGALLDRVEDGEEILITRLGKVVARLVPNPIPKPVDRAAATAAAQRIRERASREGTEFDLAQFKRDRDTGRR